MKKLLSILIVLVLCFGLVACNKTENTTSAPPPSDSVAAAPSSSGAAAPSGKPQGYLDDDVDHYARDTYQLVYLTDEFNFLKQALLNGMISCEKRFNVKMTCVDGEGSQDTYLTNLELIGTRGFDGAIVDCPPAIQDRGYELLEESGVPYVGFFQTFLDDNNRTVCPNVQLDQYDSGARPMEWLIENYKEFMGDVDISKMGVINLGYSAAPDLFARAAGPEDLFNEYLSAGTYFWVDAASAGADFFSEEVGYNLTSATVSANPQIEYWLVTAPLEVYGPGAARALEDLGKTTENALVCVMGQGANIADWDSMSEDTMSVNVACLIIHDFNMTYPAVAGVVALIDGRATKDTLWLEKTPPNYKHGNDYGVWEVPCDIVTRWTYKEYLAEVDAQIAGI